MKLIGFLLETKLFVGNIFEIIAAVTGDLRKNQDTAPEIKIFVYYLVFIVFLELYGYLPIYAYLEDYKVLSFYENSVFRRNAWWGNCLKIITTLCVSWIFISQLRNTMLRKRLSYLIIIFPVLSIISFINMGDFFSGL